MEITFNQVPYALSALELRKASEEWEHLCLMHRIVSYLADYYNLPLSLHLTTKEQQSNLLRFYNLYHLPFETLVKVHEDPVEALTDCPDQIYLFLSSLAQTYESEILGTSISEEEAFRMLLSDKEAQALDREIPSQCIQFGFFIQTSSPILICDPFTPKNDPNLTRLDFPEEGAWQTAVQMIEPDGGDALDGPLVSFLLAKSSACPFTFQQMLEQAFLWPRIQKVFTDSGVIGLFDSKYYQDPTSFGMPPVAGAGARWSKVCADLVLDFPNACIFPHGIVSCSGMGEGLYDAYFLRNAAGKVAAVAVDFLLYGET